MNADCSLYDGAQISEESVIWAKSLGTLSNYDEKIIALESTGNRPLHLVSNYPYELWLDGQFVGDGGHRCHPGEALSDYWEEAAGAKMVQVKLHWINPTSTKLFCRCLFDEIFIADLSQRGNWTYYIDESVSFAAQLSAQLPRQNIALAPLKPEKMRCPEPLGTSSDWSYLKSPIHKARYTKVTPCHMGTITLPKQTTGNFLPQQAENIALYVRDERPVNLNCITYDLQQIALYRFEVESASSHCVLYYSEVANFNEVATTRFRAKVHLADAFVKQSGSVSLFGVRGCRYVHVLYREAASVRPKLHVWRREYPLNWKSVRLRRDTPKSRTIIEACKNNLIACIDGGAVDTCWRERGQWTGDLRMSALALRALTTNLEVVNLALHQIAQSYDAETGMVNAVWPAMEANSKFTIPQFHLSFCLAALEHDPLLNRDPLVREVVKTTLETWQRLYWRDGLMQGMPGWNFTDWDYSDPVATGRNGDDPGPNAICNAWWSELCRQLKPEAAVSIEAFDKAFWMGKAYALTSHKRRESPHATAAALNCSLGEKRLQESVAYLEAEIKTREIESRVTPYFAYFLAKALEKVSNDRSITFIEDFYGPIAERYGCIYEKTNDEASLAHGWSVGISSLLIF